MESRRTIYRYDVPQSLSEESVQAALAELPEWRLTKALAYKRSIDRFLCAEAFILLKQGLKELFGLSDDISFEYESSGKPHIAGRSDIYFSISHCSRCVACIVADAPVGIDVEDIQYDRELALKAFNAGELAGIEAAEKPDVEFTRLWTMKESLLKLTGQGIVDDLPGVLQGDLPEFKIEINFERGYVLCAAAEAIAR